MYKNLTVGVLAVISLFSVTLFTPIDASAADAPRLAVDERFIDFSETDGAPYIDAGGRTQLPIRKSMESINVRVSYDNTDRSILLEKDDVQIKLTVGSGQAVINGGVLALGSEVSVTDGRSYLPARVIFEKFGYSVRWNASERIVSVTADKDNDEESTLEWTEPSPNSGAMGYERPLGVDLGLLPFGRDLSVSEFTELLRGIQIGFVNTSSDADITTEGNNIEFQILKLTGSTEEPIFDYAFRTYEGALPHLSGVAAQLPEVNITPAPGRYKLKYVSDKLLAYENASGNALYADYLSEVSRFGVCEITFDVVAE